MFTEIFSAIKDNFLEFFILIFSSGISLTGIIELVRAFFSAKKLKKHITANNDSVKQIILSETSKVFDKMNKITDSLILVVEEIKNIRILSPEQEAYIKTVLGQDKELLQKYQKALNEILSRKLNEEEAIESPVAEEAKDQEETTVEVIETTEEKRAPEIQEEEIVYD